MIINVIQLYTYYTHITHILYTYKHDLKHTYVQGIAITWGILFLLLTIGRSSPWSPWARQIEQLEEEVKNYVDFKDGLSQELNITDAIVEGLPKSVDHVRIETFKNPPHMETKNSNTIKRVQTIRGKKKTLRIWPSTCQYIGRDRSGFSALRNGNCQQALRHVFSGVLILAHSKVFVVVVEAIELGPWSPKNQDSSC